MTLSELNLAIIKWAEDRQILKHSTAYAQAFKTAEEVFELVEATAQLKLLSGMPGECTDKTFDNIRDAIGDIYVTLVVGGKCFDIEYCDNSNLDSNWSKTSASQVANPVERLQKSLIPLGAASKGQVSYWMNWLLMVSYLAQVAQDAGTTLEACVNQAYDTIKGRTGRMGSNGIWEKDT